MRLIDADVLIKDISKRPYIDNGLREIFETIIDEQPTAFDTEKVIHILECEKTIWCGIKITTTEVMKIDDAIDIVKKGGVE